MPADPFAAACRPLFFVYVFVQLSNAVSVLAPPYLSDLSSVRSLLDDIYTLQDVQLYIFMPCLNVTFF